jgi:hypothetical protein
MKKLIAGSVVFALLFVGYFTIDSCKRLNRQCFGVSWSK